MRKFLMAAALAVVALFGSSNSAEATFRLRVESGTTTGPGIVLTDGGVGDQSALANAIVFNGTIGQFALNVTTGTQTPFLVAPGYYEAMDLSNITINAGGAGTLRLILESNDFGAATPNGTMTFSSSFGGVLSAGVGSSITFASYASDASDMPTFGADVPAAGVLAALPGAGAGSIGNLAVSAIGTPALGVGGAFSGSAGTSFTTSGGYSMYTVVTVNFTTAGNVSFNQLLGTNPAPAGLVLALVGMPVMGIGAWIRRRRATPVVA